MSTRMAFARSLLVVALALAPSCSLPTVGFGATCGADVACVDGYVCDAATSL